MPLRIVLAGLLALPLTPVPATARVEGPYVDYQWIRPPTNIVEMRESTDLLKLPGVLVHACRDVTSEPPEGEDYFYAPLAKTVLLRMLDTESGTNAIHAALRPMEATPAIAYPPNARDCLDHLAQDWRKPWHENHPRPRQQGWDDVQFDLLRVPAYHGWAGTDKVSWPGGTCREEGQGDWDPKMALIIRAWLLARDHFAPGPVRDTLDDELARRAWLSGGLARHDRSVCLIAGYDVPETENHSWLITTTKYLHNEWLPPVPKDVVDDRDNLKEHITDFRYVNGENGVAGFVYGKLDEWLKDDFKEYNSRPYSRYQMIGLLNLYDLSKNDAMRSKVRAVLDLLAAKAATESLGELRSPPFRRRAEHGGDPLFDSDNLSPMMQVWVGDLAPYRRTGANFADEAVLAASSTYRPPDALTDLMVYPPHRDFHQAFNGRRQDERAYGRPGYVISGGGLQTDCPIPNPAPIKFGGHCPGSGNDSGTSQPVLIIPRRDAYWSYNRPARMAAPPPFSYPIGSVFHSTNDTGLVLEGNTCIGTALACAPGFAEGSGTTVVGSPGCRIEETDPRSHDRVTGLLFHRGCISELDWPKDQCFMIYKRQVTSFIYPLAYAITHECDGMSQRDAAAMLRRLVEVQGAQENAPTPVHLELHGLTGYELTTVIRPPAAVTGTVTAGTTPITLHLFSPFSPGKATYWMNGDPAWPDTPRYRSAFGSVAQFEGEVPDQRLRLSNAAAGEEVVDHGDFYGASEGIPDIRSISASFAYLSEGQRDTFWVRMRPNRHPEQGRMGRVRIWDAEHPDKLLAEGRQDYLFGSVDGRTPEMELTPAQPAPGHTYKVEACFWWLRYYTAEDYRTDPLGHLHQTGPSRCVRRTVTVPQPPVH